MKDIKSIVSANLSALRKQKGITQAELAEKLNYSDKAISRWEKGDTLPDLNVLGEICEFYGITMNDLTSEDCTAPQKDHRKKQHFAYRMWMCLLAGSAVWLFATIWFVYYLVGSDKNLWIAFVWAIPISCGVVMLIGRMAFNWIVHLVIGSVTVWSAVSAIIFQIYFFTEIGGGNAIWFLYLVGIPLQAMLFMFQRVWKSRAVVKTQQEVTENANRTEEPNKDSSNEE